MTNARWNVRLLRAAEFRLDAGSMFGLIPRVIWQKSVPVDERGRMTLQHNCLFLERVGEGGAGSPRRVLVEVGTGNKLDAKMREVFALENRWVGDALDEIGVKHDSIDAAVVSHLHFDHAGALTRLPREGETPDWVPPNGDDGGGGSAKTGGCVRSFPNARVFVQQREWDDAVHNRSVMTKTYYRDHLEPIREQLKLIDSGRPFYAGYTPGREEPPLGPLESRMTELWPGGGVHAFLVPGHTWGQQAILIEDAAVEGLGGTRTIVFTPDVMPTRNHAGAAYSLAYDVEPYTSMVTRRWFLHEAAERGWTLCLDHEPGNPLVMAKKAGKGDGFELSDAS